jgi:hypothetical protein
MKVRGKEGHLIYMPPDTLFTMSELFGSPLQKCNAVTGEYEADRTLTPFTLQPHFSINDKEGQLTGDHTSELVNCVWTVSARVNNAAPVRGTHYTVDDTTHALTLSCNLDPDTSGYIRFTADYIYSKRGDVHKVYWEKTLSCISTTEWKLKLVAQWPMRTNLFPWKDRERLNISVQFYNGDSRIINPRAAYTWEVWENNSWRLIEVVRDFWCRGGINSSQLNIEQKYVQRILIRCSALFAGAPSEAQPQPLTFLLRRFYGLYEDDIDILEGAYIFPETSRAVAEAFVVNRSGGRIPNPENYFDIEVFYKRGNDGWQHVAHGTRGEVPRSMFPIDSTMSHQFGEITRELTALIPFALDGQIITINNDIAVGQHPVVGRNIED